MVAALSRADTVASGSSSAFVDRLFVSVSTNAEEDQG